MTKKIPFKTAHPNFITLRVINFLLIGVLVVLCLWFLIATKFNIIGIYTIPLWIAAIASGVLSFYQKIITILIGFFVISIALAVSIPYLPYFLSWLNGV